jgi:hypothetical protein
MYPMLDTGLMDRQSERIIKGMKEDVEMLRVSSSPLSTMSLRLFAALRIQTERETRDVRLFGCGYVK